MSEPPIIKILDIPEHSHSQDTIPVSAGLSEEYSYKPTKQTENEVHRPNTPPADKETNFRLVSVAYKEAALDMPSFRASINHLDTQLAKTEDWFAALADSFLKVPHKVEEFSSIFAILDYLVPSFLQDSVLDQEHCLAAMYSSRKTLKRLWAMAFSVFKVNVSLIDRRRLEFAGHAAQYRRLRARFAACQETYDRCLLIHMGTPKFKDPELLYEDSRQLANIRQEYLQLSLELVSETHGLGAMLNQTVVSLNELFWKTKLENADGTFLDEPQIAAMWSQAQRVHAWHDACSAADVHLSPQAERARASILTHSLETNHAPASSDEFRPDIINARVLAETNEDAVEKHGYLCVKTYAEGSKSSAKPIWVRRWAFIAGGVLGFLVLGPGLESVQETDKIGVLLCSAKYTPNEDRHFCFEVKTIDTTLVLQAETLTELKSWLKVFENCRSRIVDADDDMHAFLGVASSRFPPLVAEFSAPPTTSVDRDITSPRTYTSDGQVLVSRRLSRHMERFDAFFERYVYESVGRINLPLSTAATRPALLAVTLASDPYGFPTAIDANTVGSSNWGVSAMSSPKTKLGSSLDLKPVNSSQLKKVGAGRGFPKIFPNTWIARDLQMRVLFGASIGAHEYCLFAYNCLVAPNETQELRATHFITQTHLYSYVHAVGFVSMSKMPLNRFVDAVCASSTSTYDLVHLTLVHGHLIIKLFLDDGKLIAEKLNWLCRNLASDEPLQTVELISGLLAVEKRFEEEKKMVSATAKGGASATEFEFLDAGAQSKTKTLTSVDLESTLPFLEKQTVDLPPKAVFHVLCGSESDILNALNSSVEVQLSERNLWHKSPNPDTYLMRENKTRFQIPRGKPECILVNQEIESYVENEFYSIKITKAALQVTCGPQLQFVTRITIQKTEAERSIVKVFGKTVVEGLPMYGFISKNFCRCFINEFTRKVLDKLKESSKIIGARGKILKAIYLYGKIPVSQDPFEPVVVEPVPISYLTLSRLSLQLFVSEVTRFVATCSLILLQACKITLHHISLHTGLIAIIILLALSNVYLSGMSARNFWVSRQSSNLIKELVNIEPLKIQRAVYLKDVQDLLNQHIALSEDSACFHVFKNQSVVLNYHRFANWNEIFSDTTISMKRQQLRERLNDIATRRNDLLVSLKMLNHLEEEEARSEWRIWLFDELATCSQISSSGMLQLHSDRKTLEEYCDSCAQELAGIPGIL